MSSTGIKQSYKTGDSYRNMEGLPPNVKDTLPPDSHVLSLCRSQEMGCPSYINHKHTKYAIYYYYYYFFYVCLFFVFGYLREIQGFHNKQKKKKIMSRSIVTTFRLESCPGFIKTKLKKKLLKGLGRAGVWRHTIHGQFLGKGAFFLLRRRKYKTSPKIAGD